MQAFGRREYIFSDDPTRVKPFSAIWVQIYTIVSFDIIRRDATYYLSMIIATGSSSAVCQFLCAYTGAALSEFFVYVRTLPVWLMLADLI